MENNNIPTSVRESLRAFQTPQRRFEMLIVLLYDLCLEMGFVPAGTDEVLLTETARTAITATASSPPSLHPTCWSYSYVGSIMSSFVTAPAKLIENQQQQLKHQQHERQIGAGSIGTTMLNATAAYNQTYKFTLKLLNFSERQYLLLARNVFNGDAVCITLYGDDYTGQSVVLPISRYIHTDGNDPTMISALDDIVWLSTFTNMKELSDKVKSSIILPIRNKILSEEGHRYAGLDGLPQEISWLLFDCCHVKDLQNLSRVCMKLRVEVIDYIQMRGRKIFPIERRHVPRVPAVGREPYSIPSPYHPFYSPYNLY